MGDEDGCRDEEVEDEEEDEEEDLHLILERIDFNFVNMMFTNGHLLCLLLFRFLFCIYSMLFTIIVYKVFEILLPRNKS